MPGKTRFLAPPAAGGAEPVNSRVRLFGTRSRRFEDQLKQKKERTAEGRFVLFGASNRTRTCDTIGQKHSRTASLGALALLLVSSCSAAAGGAEPVNSRVRPFGTQYRRFESRFRYKNNDPSARDGSLFWNWVPKSNPRSKRVKGHVLLSFLL